MTELATKRTLLLLVLVLVLLKLVAKAEAAGGVALLMTLVLLITACIAICRGVAAIREGAQHACGCAARIAVAVGAGDA